ncbi:alpha/beta fold hydrolase [Actinokineospora globicatena]|uniref:AB hydrolase-1 domain-containing protein n=1 Tax=Actinokineospora globicatena TaxID=103729 RepID=A0A9W6V7F1_9PSEU|nr:alpha/beta hydrolase [Actinokineospora globicatena]GLW89914.1 hypothetical protein Aglo03_07300 [Actinokineospora globicatena]
MRTIEQRAAEFGRVHGAKELAGLRYYTGGAGESVLMLPGGAGIGVSWVDLALALRGEYRTITLDYPSTATTLASLADDLVALLDAEGVDRAHVVGQSAGGMLAEVLTQRAPDRVASLVFSGTGLYGPEDVERLAGKLATIRETPWDQTVEAVREALRAVWQDSAEGAFWLSQVESAYQRAGREGLANSYAMLLDLARHSDQFKPGWRGPTLFLAAVDDPLITAAHSQCLHALHPGADLHLYSDGGHSLLLTRPSDYITEVTNHLRRALNAG